MLGSIFGAIGGKKAGKAAEGVSAEQLAFLKSIYEKASGQFQPFIEGGTQANSNIMDMLLKGDTSSFFQSPDYQFGLDEGNRQIKNNLAAGGLRNSTAALRNASKFSQDYASTRYQDFLNNLFGLSSQGTQSIGNLGNIGAGISGASTTASDQFGQAKAAKAAAPYMGAQNAIGEAGNGLMALFSDEALKENLEPLGQENGHNIYKFNYKGSKGKYIGVVAQEVEKTNPEAVTKAKNGFRKVNYHKIGVKFRKVV